MSGNWLVFVFVLLASIGMVSAVSVGNCSDLRSNLNSGFNVELTNDIDCGGYAWTMVAGGYSNTLNGNNHTISNLFYNGTDTDVALIPSPGNSIVKNLCFDNASMTGYIYASVLYGYCNGVGCQTDQVCVKNSYVKCLRGTGCSAGGIQSYGEATNSYDMKNCYVINSKIITNGSSIDFPSGGVVGYIGYFGDYRNCFSFNNTLIDLGDGIGVGGFVGTDYDSYAGFIENSFSTYTTITNATGSITTNAFAYTCGTAPVNSYYGNSTGKTDICATGNHSNSFNISGNAPMSSWDFSTIWKLGTIHPVFIWENITSPPPPDTTAPQFLNGKVNVSGTIPIGTPYLAYYNWTDENTLSYYIASWWNATLWQNTSDASFAAGSNCGFGVSYNCSGISGTFGNAGIWQFKFFANDTSNNWNVTPTINVTIASANYPQWYNYTGPLTVQVGTTASVTANWTDAVNLSAWLVSNTNTSGSWFNSSFYTSWITCAIAKRDCKLTASISTPTPGVMQWKFYVNNSVNSFNISPAISFTVVDTIAPQWVTYGVNSSAGLGQTINTQANWTDNYKLNYFIGSWWNTTHWQNATPKLFSASTCGSNCSNVSVFSNVAGIWQFKFFANDSFSGNWNVSRTNFVNVTINNPQWYNYTQDRNLVPFGDLGGVEIVVNWTDETTLNYWFCSYNNITGWFNDTEIAFTSSNQSSTYYACPLNLGFYVDNFQIKFYANNTIGGWNVSPTFLVNVTPDITPPTWWNLTLNTSSDIQNTQPVLVTAQWTDDVQLWSKFIPSYWSNVSGIWLNSSPATYTGNTSYFGITPTLPNYIWGFKFFGNDTSNNWNVTDPIYVTVHPRGLNYIAAKTCYSSDGFVYNCSSPGVDLTTLPDSLTWMIANFTFIGTPEIAECLVSFYNHTENAWLYVNETASDVGDTCEYFSGRLVEGTYGYKYYARLGTDNSWNSTPLINFTVLPQNTTLVSYYGQDSYFGVNNFRYPTLLKMWETKTQKNFNRNINLPIITGQLNGDGKDEIIVFGKIGGELPENVVNIYSNSSLTLLGQFGYGDGSVSNAIIFANYSGANTNSLMFITETENNPQFYMVLFNNSDNTITNTSTNITTWFQSNTYDGGQIALGCDEFSRQCFMFYSEYNYSNYQTMDTNPYTPYNNSAVWFSTFNKSGVEATTLLYNSSNTSCFSKYRNVPFYDYDLDGNLEWVLSTMVMNNRADTPWWCFFDWMCPWVDEHIEEAMVFIGNNSGVERNFTYSMGNYVITSELNDGIIKKDVGGNNVTLNWNISMCYYDQNQPNASKFTDASSSISNIIMSDTDGELYSDLMMAISKADWDTKDSHRDFYLLWLDNANATDDSHTEYFDPSIYAGDFSNIVEANIQTNYVADGEFCVYGFMEGVSGGLVCGKMASGKHTYYLENLDAESTPYRHDMTTSIYSLRSNLTYSNSSVGNVSRFLFRGGVLQPSYNWWTGWEMEYNYSLSQSGFSMAIACPVVDYGFSDLVFTTDDYLLYLDDGVQNNEPTLNWEFTPCFVNDYERVDVKYGENFSFRLTNIHDNNYLQPQDLLKIWYSLRPNVTFTPDYNLSACYNFNCTNGGVINGSVTGWFNGGVDKLLNLTNFYTNSTPNASFLITIQDTTGLNTTYIDYLTFADTGTIHSECWTEDNYTTTDTRPGNLSSESLFKSGMENIGSSIAMNMSAFWIFLMVLCIVAIWYGFHDKPWIAGSLSFIGIFIMSIIGNRFGWVSGWLFFLICVIMVVGIGIALKSRIFGGERRW